jgi:hypothetical protein
LEGQLIHFLRVSKHITADRLGGRWDRFSWFGLRGARDNGELSDGEVAWNQDVVVETMEALLIESLEPPLNRRRGDNLSDFFVAHACRTASISNAVKPLKKPGPVRIALTVASSACATVLHLSACVIADSLDRISVAR